MNVKSKTCQICGANLHTPFDRALGMCWNCQGVLPREARKAEQRLRKIFNLALKQARAVYRNRKKGE